MQHLYNQLVSLPNLLAAWLDFKKTKENKLDVQQFAFALEDNLFDLWQSLQEGRYRHGSYHAFYIRDPKLRSIHKATVQDRILHHAVAKILDREFDRGFIYDSYSSRDGKGLHRAVRRVRSLAWRLGKNRTRTVWFLKCDVRKFFDSVDHERLIALVRRRIQDEQLMTLIRDIIASFHTKPGKGIPLGNLTSQVFSNIYLNPFDQFVKRTLCVKAYVRYADDFVIASCDRYYLEALIGPLQDFLQRELCLELHPDKITLRKWHQGLDFLGYVVYPRHTILRTKTKRRMLRKLKERIALFQEGMVDEVELLATVHSYRGILQHCRGHGLDQLIRALVPIELPPDEEGPKPKGRGF